LKSSILLEKKQQFSLKSSILLEKGCPSVGLFVLKLGHFVPQWDFLSLIGTQQFSLKSSILLENVASLA
jgi:hypothetical protein